MKTALLVIDMQNSFLHDRGEHYYPQPEGFLANVHHLLSTARAVGALVVHVADRHREGFADFEQGRVPPHCLADRFDALYFEGFGPAGRRQEIEIVKRRYSAFFATDLALFLAEQSVNRVVICGVKANVCVRATAQDAFAHGFDVCVAGDATSSNREALARASLEDIDRYMGRVVSTSEAAGMLACCD